MKYRHLPILILITLSACSTTPQKSKPPETDRAILSLKEATFKALPGWGTDNLHGFASAFQHSCHRIIKAPASKKIALLPEAGTYKNWQNLCMKFKSIANESQKEQARFIETHFTPYQVLADQKEKGLFTGYYEASLRGSRTRHGAYQTPLYHRADDLVMVQLGDFRDDLKGRRIAGRVINGALKPYESRTEITKGNWPHNNKTLLWVDSPVDAFFVQIQGSGLVTLAEGGTMRIGYAGQNGHPYYAIGRELIKRGAIAKKDMSMQAIRHWLESNPAQAAALMNTNASYVFFKELKESGPLGGEGVPLTSQRSLAIDHTRLPYGVPLWVDIEAPVKNNKENTHRLQRLMMTQDTGGAIRGPVRGDVFWGHGPEAEQQAGPMKSQGRYWILLPRTK